MAAVCPKCKSTNIHNGFDQALCIDCGTHLNYADNGALKVDKDRDGLAVPGPADSSAATPTATPVYEEEALTRQPVVDTNTEPVLTPNEPGVMLTPAPDVEAQNVAGELSDETAQEKKHGGPDDQPRTAELTVTGKPEKDTFVKHSTDDELIVGNDDLVDASREQNDERLAERVKEQKAAKKAAAKAVVK